MCHHVEIAQTEKEKDKWGKEGTRQDLRRGEDGGYWVWGWKEGWVRLGVGEELSIPTSVS